MPPNPHTHTTTGLKKSTREAIAVIEEINGQKVVEVIDRAVRLMVVSDPKLREDKRLAHFVPGQPQADQLVAAHV